MLEKPLGIMLYGYDEDDAFRIKRYLSLLTERDVMLITASGREKDLVSYVIGEAIAEPFEAKEIKLLMFLGFKDNQIGAAMKFFLEDVEKPIFCALTKENANWALGYLIKHLLEEKARLSG